LFLAVFTPKSRLGAEDLGRLEAAGKEKNDDLQFAEQQIRRRTRTHTNTSADTAVSGVLLSGEVAKVNIDTFSIRRSGGRSLIIFPAAAADRFSINPCLDKSRNH
jgi:hypothetical protein